VEWKANDIICVYPMSFYGMHNPRCVMISQVPSTEASTATRTCQRLNGALSCDRHAEPADCTQQVGFRPEHEHINVFMITMIICLSGAHGSRRYKFAAMWAVCLP
jgi:hypothetical protein